MKNFQQLYDIGEIFRYLFRVRPTVTILKVLLLQNREDSGIQTFRNESQDHHLALGSERESTKLNRSEKFEYWVYSRQTNNF